MRMVFTLMLSLLLFTMNLKAETPEQKGLSIIKEADLRNTGFLDFTANILMTLRNRHGQESIRQMRIKVLEGEEDGDKSLTIVDNPRDV